MSTPDSNGLLRDLDLCFLDIETTGSIFNFHEIIEIAAIRTSSNGAEVRGTWQRRLRPNHPERITLRAAELTGFSVDAWMGASSSDSIFWEQFTSFARGCVPVCHNPSFDRAFITLAAAAANHRDLGLDYHWIGTESLAWPLHSFGGLERLSLAALCRHLGLEEEPAQHNAFDGALACRRVYLALMDRLEASDYKYNTYIQSLSYRQIR